VTFDPKTALERCKTLMLDMDGTILDLAYDNYMWLTHIPERWGEKNGMSLSEARKHLFTRYGAVQGDLHWYCLDHWSERLDLDVMQLHRDNHERIDFLPGAREFLAAIHAMDIEVLLVTNSHGDTLELKDQVTGLGEYFDGIHSSHSYGFAKERQEFWGALQAEVGFDPQTTMFVDDTISVLRSAAEFGVEYLLAITRPDTSEPPREGGEFKGVEGVANLLL
jgi:HAD superfamily hydrolase (TIGR01509 family)